VINSADGARTDIGSGEGILVSCAEVAGKEQKIRLSKAYGASAVDMEAAAVAQGAEARGVEFGVLKVISDAADFELPALDRFAGHDGTFHSVRFVCHVALRPWLWGTTITLARNSSRASRALCGALDRYLIRETSGCPILPAESSSGRSASDRSGSNRNDLNGPMFAGAHTRTGDESHTRVGGKE